MVYDLLFRFLMFSVFSIAARGGSWWEIIPETFRLVFPLVLFFVNLLVLGLVLYLAGLVVVGGKRALFSDALIVSFLGTVLSTLFFLFIPYSLIALALGIVVWLFLIKRFYETGWFGAVAVGLLAIVIFLAVTVILALIFGILDVVIERFLLFMILPL